MKCARDELFRYASVVRLGGTGFLGGSLAEGAFWDFFPYFSRIPAGQQGTTVLIFSRSDKPPPSSGVPKFRILTAHNFGRVCRSAELKYAACRYGPGLQPVFGHQHRIPNNNRVFHAKNVFLREFCYIKTKNR